MGLTSDVISEFVKSTKDNTKTQSESTVHATTVEYNGRIYVKIDGSDLLTPVSKTVDVKADERVTVLIKDHSATITGNVSSPAARTDDVKEVADKMTEVEILMAYKVTTDDLTAVNAAIEKLKATNAYIDNIDAIKAEIESLEALFADVEHLSAGDIEAITANIESIEAIFGTFTNVSTDDLEAINAEIGNLKAYTADFTYVSAEVLEAVKASIKTLEAEKLSVKDAEIKYANIDFSNISKAAMEYFYATSGLIHNVTIGDATISGRLVGVTISGSLIEGGTIVADKLAIKGDDGLYYKLNVSAYDELCYEVKMDSETGEYTETDTVVEPVNGVLVEDTATTNGDYVYLYTTEDGNEIYYIKTFVYNGERVDVEQVPRDTLNGNVITANSITAEKIDVKDLVAFEATIGGFEIGDDSIHSFGKDTIENTTRGAYFGKDGQTNIGDASSFVKFYKDEEGNYRLVVSADTIVFGGSGKNVESELSTVSSTAKHNQTVANESVLEIEEIRSLLRQIVTDENGQSLMISTDESYILTDEIIEDPLGEVVNGVTTTTGEEVYLGKSSEDDSNIYYSVIDSVCYKVTYNPATCTFNISDIEAAINGANNNISNLSTELSNVDAIVDQMQKTVTDLAILGGYVIINENFELKNEDGTTETVPAIILGESGSDFKVVITNKQIAFYEGSTIPAYISGQTLIAQRIDVKVEFAQTAPDSSGQFIWKIRSNGNYGLSWKEGVN